MTPPRSSFTSIMSTKTYWQARSHAKDSPRFRELISELRSQGEWNFPYEIFISVQLHEKGTMMINTTRICDVDGTDGLSISRGMMQGRSEVNELMRLMRKHFPGFANARIRTVAPVLGIRETRRIVGDFIYTVDDLVAARDFPDTIGFSGYGWDLPDPKRPSYQPMHGVKRKRPYTPIPFRCLVPRPIQNVICPGRAISVERDVLGPLREQAPCYAMGHAAGPWPCRSWSADRHSPRSTPTGCAPICTVKAPSSIGTKGERFHEPSGGSSESNNENPPLHGAGGRILDISHSGTRGHAGRRGARNDGERAGARAEIGTEMTSSCGAVLTAG